MLDSLRMGSRGMRVLRGLRSRKMESVLASEVLRITSENTATDVEVDQRLTTYWE